MIWPNPITGGSREASWLERLRQACRSWRLLPGAGYRIKQTPDGIILNLLPQSGGSAPAAAGIELFQVVSVQGDILECYPASYGSDGTLIVQGAGGAGTEAIALPWYLRAAQQPYPTATVYPPFTPLQGSVGAQMVYAVKVGVSITGIVGCDYLLVNHGRFWSDTFVVCANGIPSNRQMPAGPAS